MAAQVYAEGTPGSGSLDTQPGYGDHPSLAIMDPAKIQIYHKAKFANISNCLFSCDMYDMSKNRKYFWVLENGYEKNDPVALQIACVVVPPNCCCPGFDNVSKTYFDRGIFDRQHPCFKTGCLNGPPTIYAGPVKNVCCCIDCCDCWNHHASGYYACCCGERVSILPFENYYYCCPTRSWWACNCCGLCGVKTGEPMPAFTQVIATHLLDISEAQKLADEFNNCRNQWKSRTGYTAD
mmetsp:Transcript_33405/g.34038  ORF Transcript_33405/g.34038 Transcript_33405/m.34038 type:complete len:237 (-) Transcript_33405:334-1044(-)|eukprot:CAMPEP_0182417010 /NCGR_PEP_ID=MMETSP1167-20130531/1451_1 /TAXON_ID=2988 /ORGANISM="Mallomonas Sp, Strain CCMP3275" /LENGTH=236 /DNA_ID=CAMNT_0024590277 /DNA_START=67 /DNA_END=777 /DNA_ORIENTATION=+